jgi:hypothetical protein
VREQAFLQGKLAPGSVPSEMLHMLMQFKTWPLAALHQKIAREFHEGLTTGDKIWGIGLLTGLSMLGGYIRMTARDLAYGDQPRTPKNIGDAFKIGGAAIAQGGGLGLLGDYLFGEINRLGAGAASAGGPIGTDIGRLYEIYNRSMRYIGDDKHQPGDVWLSRSCSSSPSPLPRRPVGDRSLGSLLTLRWSKGDSNSWSHPERQGSEGATQHWRSTAKLPSEAVSDHAVGRKPWLRPVRRNHLVIELTRARLCLSAAR